ncbi:MAG: esterase/lipase family protein [Bacillota bacterium]
MAVVRITRLLLLIQFAIALAMAAFAKSVFHIPNNMLALALGIAAVLLVRLSITANNFSLAWHFRSETPQAYCLNFGQAIRLFFGEFRATMTASSWTMPFHTFSMRVADKPAALPVLLIHGYGCNSGYWHAMSAALAAQNISHYALDMEPLIGSIDAYVPMIHEAVERICGETGSGKIVIVAHSMGGLATRAYLRDHGDARIAKAVTLGTPHHGTALARFGIGINTKQMLWTVGEQEGLSSKWLRELAENEDKAVYRRIVSLYSHHDNIIAPQVSSRLDGAVNLEFQGIGHVALAMHPAIQAQVIREIRSASVHAAAPSAEPARQ